MNKEQKNLEEFKRYVIGSLIIIGTVPVCAAFEIINEKLSLNLNTYAIGVLAMSASISTSLFILIEPYLSNNKKIK